MTRQQNIRIFHGCEVLIENSVTRVTVRHHEACRVTEFFQFEPKNHYGFFFLHTLPSTIAFRLEISNFYRSSLIRVYTVCHSVCIVWTHYSTAEPHSSNFRVITTILFFGVSEYLGNLRYVDVEMFGGNWRQDVKNDVKIVILTSCMTVVLHHSCKTTFPSPGCVHGNPGRVCKKRNILSMDNPMSQGSTDLIYS